jgi:hypothetical protein
MCESSPVSPSSCLSLLTCISSSRFNIPKIIYDPTLVGILFGLTIAQIALRIQSEIGNAIQTFGMTAVGNLLFIWLVVMRN